MTWRYIGFSLMLLIATCARYITDGLSSPERIESVWLEPQPDDDPEGNLAMGRKLPLGCVDLWSLELIKGVSDTLASELLRKRYTIISAARTTEPSAALQLAHGIGEIKSADILSYLELTDDCRPTSPFTELQLAAHKPVGAGTASPRDSTIVDIPPQHRPTDQEYLGVPLLATPAS